MVTYKVPAGTLCLVRPAQQTHWQQHRPERDVVFTAPPCRLGNSRVFFRDGWELKVDFRSVVEVRSLDETPKPLNFRNYLGKGKGSSRRSNTPATAAGKWHHAKYDVKPWLLKKKRKKKKKKSQ